MGQPRRVFEADQVRVCSEHLSSAPVMEGRGPLEAGGRTNRTCKCWRLGEKQHAPTNLQTHA